MRRGVLRAGFVSMLLAAVLASVNEKAIADPSPSPGPSTSASVGSTSDGGGYSETASTQPNGAQRKPKRNVAVTDPVWPRTKVVNCGPRVLRGRMLATTDPFCQFVRNDCTVGSIGALPRDPYATTTATLELDGPKAEWLLVADNCNARRARPQVTPWMVRQEIIKRLRPVPIGAAPPPGESVLVNTQWIAWLPTPAEKDLGRVTLLGYQVALRIHLEHVDWDYGDGATGTTTTPGKVYDHVHDRCHTATCGDYLGHIYTKSGAFIAKAAITWSGQYSVDRGAWLDIPGTVTPAQGPATLPVAVIEARSVLVPSSGPN